MDMAELACGVASWGVRGMITLTRGGFLVEHVYRGYPEGMSPDCAAHDIRLMEGMDDNAAYYFCFWANRG